MAEEIISSFDLDTRAALAQVDSLIKGIDKLEKELNQLQKEGKDTSAVTAELARQTATLDKVLAQETQTVKGSVAAAQAMQRALDGASEATKKQTKVQQGLDAQTKKTATSFVTLIGRSKNLSQAFARGAGQLSNLVGGFGLSTIAISSLSSVIQPAIDQLFSFVGVSKEVKEAQDSATQAIRGAVDEYANEARDLNGLLEPLSKANTSTADRAKLIEEIKNRYPEYLKGLTDEDFKIGNIAATQKILNDRLLDGILLRAKEQEQAKILGQILSNEIELSKLRQKGITEESDNLGELAKSGKDVVEAIANPLAFASIDRIGEAAEQAKKSLDVIEFARLKKEQADLIQTQKDLDKRFEEAGAAIKSYNLELGANKSAADKAVSAQKDLGKEVESTASKIAKANQEIADNLAKNFDNLDKQTEPLVNSLAGLQSALAAIEKQIKEQTAITDFEQYAELTAQAEALRKEIELVELAVESLNKKPVEIKATSNVAALEEQVESARLSLGQLRAEQAQQNLDLARQEAAALERVRSSESAQAAVKKAFAVEAEKVKRQQAIATLRAQEEVAKAELALARSTGEIFGAAAVEAEADLAEIQRQLLGLSEAEYQAQIKLKVDSDDADKALRKKISELAEFAQGISDKAFDVLNSANQRAQERLDASITRQSAALEALLSNVETANVEQVRLEQERLDKLNAERQKAADKERALAVAQIATNVALAVAKTAGDSGIAAPITIATTLAAIAFGFIQARQAATAAYHDGTPYLDDPKAPRGRDTITIRADRGEAIIPTQTNAEYSDAVRAIYEKRLPSEKLNRIARMSEKQLNELLGGHASDSYQFMPDEAKIKHSPKSIQRRLVLAEARAVQGGGGQSSGGLSRAEALDYIDKIVSAMPRQKLSGRELVTVVQSGAAGLESIKKKSRIK